MRVNPLRIIDRVRGESSNRIDFAGNDDPDKAAKIRCNRRRRIAAANLRQPLARNRSRRFLRLPASGRSKTKLSFVHPTILQFRVSRSLPSLLVMNVFRANRSVVRLFFANYDGRYICMLRSRFRQRFVRRVTTTE